MHSGADRKIGDRKMKSEITEFQSVAKVPFKFALFGIR